LPAATVDPGSSSTRILLLGVGPASAWTRGFLEAEIATAAVELVDVSEPATPAMLANLLAEPIAALVLVDHRPFAAGLPTPATASTGEASAGAALEAVRAEAYRAVAALELARRSPRTLRLEAQAAAAWPAALTGLLDELLPGRASSRAGRHSRGRVVRASVPPDMSEALTALAALEGAVQSLAPPLPVLLSGYLRPLFEAAGTLGHAGGTLSVIWPRDCFLHGDRPGATLPETVEIAGRARILAYGPYLPLPSGIWTVTAWLGFSAEIERIPFILEVDTGEAITRGFFEVERGGIFTLELEFRVPGPMPLIELRLISQDAALEGLTALIEAGLVRSLF
jgi:hypothetical protein